MPFFRRRFGFDPFREFEKMFEDDWPSMFSAISKNIPAADVYETEKDLVVEMNLPNIDPEKVEITLENQTLRVQGGEDIDEEEKGKDYYRREIRKGKFSRVINLPVKVKEEEVKAEYKDGILKITIPKAEPHKEGKKIKIEVKK